MARSLKALSVSAASFAVFALLVFVPMLGPKVESQPAPTDTVNLNTKLVWSHDNKDINNLPEVIGRFEVAISQTNQDLSTGGTPLAMLQVQYPCPECPVDTVTLGTTCEYPIADLIRGRSPGYYRLWVRAVDSAGNIGAYSSYLTIQIDSSPPKPPTGLKCK